MSEEELRAVWIEAGRPGVAKFYAAALRSGLVIKRQVAQEFVKIKRQGKGLPLVQKANAV